MDTPTEKYKADYGNRSEPFITMLRSIHGFLRKLTGVFKVTEKDLSDAGIYLGGEGRD